MPGLRTPYATTYAGITLAYSWGEIYDRWGGSNLDRGSLGVTRLAVELWPRPVHIPVNTLNPFLKVAASGQTAIWLDAGTRPVFTGRNTNGERGEGTTANTTKTTPLSSANSGTSDVTAGGDFRHPSSGGTGGTMFMVGYQSSTLGENSDNDVFACGANTHGQMGMGDTTQRSTITRVWRASVYGAANAVRVHMGEFFTAILDSLGRVWTAGRNDVGQLGQGTSGADVTTWAQIAMPSGGRWYTDLACAQDNMLLLVNDGTVWGAGRGGQGQLGPGVTGNALSPAEVTGISGVAEVMSQGATSWFRTTDGRLLVYGQSIVSGGMAGTTGSDLFTSAIAAPREINIDWANNTYPFVPSSPQAVTVAKLGYLSGIAAASAFYAVIGSDGRLYTLGSNIDGQRGNGEINAGEDQDRIFYSSNGLTSVTGATVSYAAMYAWGADGTFKMLHFSVGPLQDCKMLRQVSSGPADPTNWETTGFDDSAWPTPIEITPDPAFPPIQMAVWPRTTFWDRIETGTNLNTLVRLWATIPADAANAGIEPGIRSLYGQVFQPYGGPFDNLLGQGTLIGGASGTDVAPGNESIWINGQLTDLVLWSDEIAGLLNPHPTPGIDNLFCVRMPDGRTAHQSTTGDHTFWAELSHVIGYLLATFTPQPPTTGASRGRSYAQVVG